MFGQQDSQRAAHNQLDTASDSSQVSTHLLSVCAPPTPYGCHRRTPTVQLGDPEVPEGAI